MKNSGLLAVCMIRLITQLTWSVIGEYWYFVGQSMFETYLLLYAMLSVSKTQLVYPFILFFTLSVLNFISDLIGVHFGHFYPMIVALLATFGAFIWNKSL